MNEQGRDAAALQLARAEAALRAQWRRRNLHLPGDRINSALAAQKKNARAAIRWYIGEIRWLRLRVPGLATSAFGRPARTPPRGGRPGYPVQIWTRAVSTAPSTAPRASWIPLPMAASEKPGDDRSCVS